MAAQTTKATTSDPRGGDDFPRRLVSLAIDFYNATLPLSSERIRADHYAGDSLETFYRQFRRDRERLVRCGLSIVEVPEGGWVADETSFADEVDAHPDDLIALTLTCLELAEDPSFPYRNALRNALAKLGKTLLDRDGDAILAAPEPFDEQPGADGSDAQPSQNKHVTTLLQARRAHHCVQVRYTDAKGATSDRTLGLCGEFGLRGHLYFVACDLGEDGSTSEPRVFRDDRFHKVKELVRSSYVPPEDFCAEDWRRLPFQIGPTTFEACFVLNDDVSDEALRACSGEGRVEKGQHGGHLWFVSASDVTAAAAWGIAQSLTPQAPQELVDEWKRLLGEARS